MESGLSPSILLKLSGYRCGRTAVFSVSPTLIKVASALPRSCPRAPHPLIRTGPDVDLPQQRYTLEFYPSAPDPSGAGRFTLAAGSDLRSIDFQVRTIATVTVRG